MSDYRFTKNGKLKPTRKAGVRFLVNDCRRAVASRWKAVSLAIYEWIWP